MLGGVFCYVDHFALQHGSSDPSAFALVGMGAVFAGIIRAPITSVLIMFEMTGSNGLILPLMISNMTAFAPARHFRPIPIYEALLQQICLTRERVENDNFSTYPVIENGHTFIGLVTETRLRRTAAEGGSDQKVATVVQTAPRTLPTETLVRAVVRMEKSGARQLGVIDSNDGNRLIGLLTMTDIVRAHARAAMDAGDADGTESPDLSEKT